MTFQDQIEKTFQHASNNGALKSIKTEIHLLDDAHVRFLLHVPTPVTLGKSLSGDNPEGTNPFLPFDKALFVADISETHVCILNKYNIVDQHLLVITREFEPQDRRLSQDDLLAIWLIVEQLGGVGFFNAGLGSGASQNHKHLQWIQSPLGDANRDWKLSLIFSDVQYTGKVGRSRNLPFDHGLIAFDRERCNASYMSEILDEGYSILRDSVSLTNETEPYNLILTRDCMVLVPRSIDSWRDISINALGFAGSILVPDHHALEMVRQVGPMYVLSQVGRPI